MHQVSIVDGLQDLVDGAILNSYLRVKYLSLVLCMHVWIFRASRAVKFMIIIAQHHIEWEGKFVVYGHYIREQDSIKV